MQHRRRSRWPCYSRQGDDIAPIPGTKRVSRVEDDTAADNVELSAEQIAQLNNLTPATGKRHEERNMGCDRPLTTTADMERL
jgi:diketogulonate reductase-like aldo/keto reductase